MFRLCAILFLLTTSPLSAQVIEVSEDDRIQPAGIQNGDFFGASVALEGDVAVISEIQPNAGVPSGSVHVFRRTGGVWVQEQEILGLNSLARFGETVAVDGNVLVVEQSGALNLGPAGAAHVFRFNGTNWQFEALLSPPPAVTSSFPKAISIRGNTIAVGEYFRDQSAGEVSIFEFDGAVWNYTELLVPADRSAGDQFGASVLFDGDFLFIGATGDRDFGSVQGSVYVYQHNGISWVEVAELHSSDGEVGNSFGLELAARGEILVVGAPTSDSGGAADAGAAYVFRDFGSGFTEEQKLTAADAPLMGNFGAAVETDGQRILIGSPGRTGPAGFSYGRIDVYEFDGSEWVADRFLQNSDGSDFDQLGDSIAFDGTRVLSTLPGYDATVTSFQPEGAVNVYELESEFVRGDCNGSGGIDVADPVFLLDSLFTSGIPVLCDDACDGNDDGGVNLADAISLLSALFAGGTPPPAPNSCGGDPTADALGCAEFSICP